MEDGLLVDEVEDNLNSDPFNSIPDDFQADFYDVASEILAEKYDVDDEF